MTMLGFGEFLGARYSSYPEMLDVLRSRSTSGAGLARRVFERIVFWADVRDLARLTQVESNALFERQILNPYAFTPLRPGFILPRHLEERAAHPFHRRMRPAQLRRRGRQLVRVVMGSGLFVVPVQDAILTTSLTTSHRGKDQACCLFRCGRASRVTSRY